jgi:hypothetical protein
LCFIIACLQCVYLSYYSAVPQYTGVVIGCPYKEKLRVFTEKSNIW